MRKLASLWLILFSCPAWVAAASAQEIVDPAEAAKDPDFAIQGEYLGEGQWPDGGQARIGAQVVARGKGEFAVVLYCGGLPGDGWNRGDPRLSLTGQREEKVVRLRAEKLSGEIAEGKLIVSDAESTKDAGSTKDTKDTKIESIAEGKPRLRLARTERKSPTLEAKPPAGAVVLFDGSNVEQWRRGTLTAMKTLEPDADTKTGHRMAKLHLEFRLSFAPTKRGQGRSNSGVYLGGVPEIQILDSFGLEGRNNECAGFYGAREPDVNMCLPPLVWQTYDVEFSEPGDPNAPARVTLRHNGVVVHEGFELKKPVEKRTIHLQRHGNRVQFRNIWVVEKP